MLFRNGDAPRKGTREMLKAYSALPYFRTSVSKIAGGVASTPLRLYKKNGADGRAKYSRRLKKMPTRDFAALVKAQEDRGDISEIEDHPLLDLLDAPNPFMGENALMKLIASYWLMVGDVFVVLNLDDRGLPAEAFPVPPTWVQEYPSKNRPYFKVTINGATYTIPQDQMLWMREIDPANPYGNGTGIGGAVSDELDTDENAAKFVSSYFYNRAMPDMIVSLAGAKPETLARAKEKFENSYRGFEKAYRTAWTSGDLTVERLDTSFSDMDLVELRRFEREIVLQTFGLSPEMVGVLDNSNRASIQEARAMFAENVLTPLLDAIKSELQRTLVPFYDERLILAFDDPTPDDRQFRLEVMSSAPAGYFTKNDWRDLANLDPSEEDGEMALVDGGTYAVDSLADAVAPKPVEAPAPIIEAQSKGVRKDLTEDEIEEVLRALRPERLTAEVYPLAEETIAEFGAAEAARLGAPQSFSMLNPLITQYLDEFSSTKITGLVNETTRAAIRGALIEGVREGEDIRRLAGRVRSVFSDADRRRATVIARTEVVGMSNRATYAAQKMSGLVKKRRWLATMDSRTRDPHMMLNGQERGIDEPFEIDGMAAMHPGGFGRGDLDIQCRCTTIPVISDPEERSAPDAVTKDDATEWADFDARVSAREVFFERAIRRGFSTQREDVLDALFRVGG
jgi:HK97 family phage portal protein